MSEFVGQVIRGYEIRDRLGEGGFGAVYRAYQSLLKREVAIKVILPKYANEPEFIRRFEVEAELIARLESPYIIPLFDYWRDPEGAYLVMRLIKGGSIRDAMKDKHFTPQETADILDQIAKALQVAHRENVIHRDIKPDNMLIDVDDNVYLSDFGIAKVLDGVEDTGDEGISGSIHYIPPEQLQGAPVTPKTDIYALGMVLYELLAGIHPFHGKTLTEIILGQMNEPVPDISTVLPDYPDLNAVIQRATAKDPDKRFPDVMSLAKEFRASIHSEQMIELDSFYDLDLEVELPNPYKGLQAFQENDSDKFYGRGTLVEMLLGRMITPDAHQRFLAVIGASGSGKSSVVKAGLIPALRKGGIPGSENWFVADMFPGTQPFVSLEAALSRVAVHSLDNLPQRIQEANGIHEVLGQILPAGDTQLVLIIDQFEELFTQVEDEAIRARFLENLTAAFKHPDSRLRVIVTLRADFYDKPLQYLEFGQILRQRMETILPLSEEELAESIERPAEMVGAHYEPGLVNAIISDVGEQPGTLPLLQFALTELFERRQGYRLTLEAYQQIGGVIGALAGQADELFLSLDTAGQEAVRQLFLRLVTIGEGSDDTRRRVRRSELPDNPMLDEVLNLYGKSRLLMFDRDSKTREATIEVAHEAIIRTWQRVRGWIDDSREILLHQRRLTTNVQEWQAANEDPSFLATGARLIQFEAILNTDLVLNQTEQEFLRASILNREEKRRIDEARKEHELELQRQAANRLRYLVGVMVVFLIVAVVLSFWALNGQTLAQNNAATAVAAEATAVRGSVVSDSRALAERLDSIAENQPFVAYALARDLLLNVSDVPYTIRSQALATLINTQIVQRIDSPGEAFRIAVYTQDASGIVTGTGDGRLSLWDAVSGLRVLQYESSPSQIAEIVMIPKSDQFITINDAREIMLWNLYDVTPVGRLFEQLSGVISIAITPDGQTALLGNGGGWVAVIDMSNREVKRQFKIHEETILTLAISEDGTYGVSGSTDGTIGFFNVATGESLHVIEGHSNTVFDVELTADDTMAVSASTDGLIKVWDFATGTLIREITSHTDAVFDTAVTADDRFILSVSQDETLIFQRLNPVAPLTYSGHNNAIYSVDISPDGTRAITASIDGRIVIWSLDVGERYDRLAIPAQTSRGLTFSEDGNTAFVNLDDNYIVHWDWKTGEILQRYDDGPDTQILGVEYIPGRNEIVSGTEDGRMLRFDVATGELLQAYRGHTERVWSARPLPDGRRALTGSIDTSTLLWDLDTGEILQEYSGVHTDDVITAEFSPDLRFVATSSSDSTIGIWNLETGELITQLKEHTGGVIRSVFTSDSRLMLSHSHDGGIVVWDTETWEIVNYLDGHKRTVIVVRILPGDRYVLSGSWDESLILWDLETGEVIRKFENNGSRLRNAAVSPDGQYAINSTVAGPVFLWWINPDPDTVLEWAEKTLVIPPLSCEDREFYLTPLNCNDDAIAGLDSADSSGT